MAQALPLLLAAAVTRAEDERAVRVRGAEVVLHTDPLRGSVPYHSPGKDLEVVADCVRFEGPDLTLPGRSVTIVCRELQLPADGFTVNVSGPRAAQDFSLGWQAEGGAAALKAAPGGAEGADGHQG
eukprot:EG_transcript_51491